MWPGQAALAKRSPGAGDPHDRGVANSIAHRDAAGGQEQSRGQRQPDGGD